MTVQFMPHGTAPELANALKSVLTLYKCACFICQTALMDNEFEMVKDHLIHCIEINSTAKKKYVPKIERMI